MASYVTKSIFSFSAILVALFLTLPIKAAPKGYCVLQDKDITYQIVKIARSMLNKPLGTCTPFSIGEKNYQGCVEYHWDQVKGKHIGVTVYTECKPK
jgi:hypothetical protein